MLKWISSLFRPEPEFECLKSLSRDGLSVCVQHGRYPDGQELTGARIFAHSPDAMIQVAAVLSEDLPTVIWLLSEANEFLQRVPSGERLAVED